MPAHAAPAQVVMHSPDAIAPVGVLHPTAFHVEPKATTSGGPAGASTAPSAPLIIEVPAEWRPEAEAPGDASGGSIGGGSGGAGDSTDIGGVAGVCAHVAVRSSARHVHISCMPQVGARGHEGVRAGSRSDTLEWAGHKRPCGLCCCCSSLPAAMCAQPVACVPGAAAVVSTCVVQQCCRLWVTVLLLGLASLA